MSPALEPGDRVLMRRGVRGLRAGVLVVVARPDEITGWTAGAVLDTDLSVADRFVKRVAAVAGEWYPAAMRRGGVVPHGHVVVLGDHPHSVDSKQYGPCPLDQVLGVEVRLPGGWRAGIEDRPLPSSTVRHNRRMSGIPDLLPDDHTGRRGFRVAGSRLWQTKTIEQSIADTDEPGHRLKRTLGPWDLTVFGVAVVIGAGVFTLAASTAGDRAGPAVIIAFIIAAIACGLAALCYAEFASSVPVAGSAYTYSYAVFGEFIAWIIGWDLVLEFSVAAGAVAKGWSLYLVEAAAQLGAKLHTTVVVAGVSVDWGALLLIAALTTVLAAGINLSAKVSAVITAIKVSVVLLVIVVGAFYITPSNYVPFVPPSQPAEAGVSGLDSTLFATVLGDVGAKYGWFGVLAGASIVFFAFIGFDIVATTAEETRNPQRDMPRGILGSLAIVTVLYIGTALVMTGMQKYTELATKVDPETGEPIRANLATAFTSLGVDWAASIIAFGALAGLTTVVLVLMLGQIRVSFAMSRDRLLPGGWSITGKRGTPVRLTVGIGILVAVLAGFLPIDRLEEMVNVGTLFAFVLVSIGVIVLRAKRPDLQRGFRAPGVPVLPIVAVLACLWLMVNLSVLTWLRFIGWMVLGLVVYFAYGFHKAKLGR